MHIDDRFYEYMLEQKKQDMRREENEIKRKAVQELRKKLVEHKLE